MVKTPFHATHHGPFLSYSCNLLYVLPSFSQERALTTRLMTACCLEGSWWKTVLWWLTTGLPKTLSVLTARFHLFPPLLDLNLYHPKLHVVQILFVICSQAGIHYLTCCTSWKPGVRHVADNDPTGVFFYFPVCSRSAIHLSLQTISTKVVCLIAATCPTPQWSARVCRPTQLPVPKLEFAFTGGTTPQFVVFYSAFWVFFFCFSFFGIQSTGPVFTISTCLL